MGVELARGRKAAAVDTGPVEGPWNLPDGWRWERLEAVAPVNPGRNFDGIPDDAKLAFLGMAAVTELTGALDLTEQRPLASVRSGFTRFRSGDVIFAKITPCMENGKLAIIPDLPHCMGAGSTEFHVLEPQRVSDRYLFHWLSQETFRNRAEHNMTGTAGQKRVPTDWLRNAPIPVPPTAAAQVAIVSRIDDLFAEIDEGEAALAEARAGVETYRKALLKAAVTGELTADWRQANPPQETGEHLLQRILADRRARWKADPKNARKKYVEPSGPDTDGLPDLPAGWAWASLDQLSWSAQYGTSQKCDYDGTGEPVLRIPNLRAGAIDLADLKRSLVGLALEAEDYVHPGDLLVVRTNGSEALIGRAGVALAELAEPTFLASYLIRYRLTGDHKRWRWIRAFTESSVFRYSVLASIGSSAGQYNLSMGKLDTFPVALPPDAEIDVALSAYAKAYAQVPEPDLVDTFVSQASTLRQSILAAAFRGELTA